MIVFGSENDESKTLPFILDIRDNIDNELSIIVSLAIRGEQGSKISDSVESEKLRSILVKSYPIEPDNNNVFEIKFERYIMYQTLNESYCLYDDYARGQGTYFMILEHSHLLDQLKTFVPFCTAFEDGTYYPGKPIHFRIISPRHVLDVICDSQPIIRKFD